MAKFRKKPVVVEAFQLTSSEYPNDEEVSALHAWTSVHGLTNWFSDYDGGAGGAPFCILAIWISFLEICPSFCSFVYQVYYLLGNFFMICAYTLSILGAIPLLDVCNLNNF